MDLNQFFDLRSIAVVGANDREGSFGYCAAYNALQCKGRVRVYLINNRKSSVQGEKTYDSLSALPELVDCVLIATPRDSAVEVFEEAAQAGVKRAIVYASGFSEESGSEGRAAEDRLMKISKEYGIPFIGPNCIGILDNIHKLVLLGVDATTFDMKKRKTGVALIAQSGSVCINAMKAEYMGLSYIFSTGNGNMVTIDDAISFCVDSSDVRVVAIYLEGIKDAAAFTNALKKAARIRKPIVILKSGKSKKGAAATASHTGNMAGSGKAFESVFKKYGVISVDSVHELLETAHLLSVIADDMPRKGGFAFINSSGGENTVCADLCEKYDIELPSLNETIIERLSAILPSYGTASNPLDQTVTLSTGLDANLEILNAFTDDSFGAIVVGGQSSFYADEDVAKNGDCTDTEKVFDTPWVRYKMQEHSLALMVAPPYSGVANLVWRRNLERFGIGILAGGEMSYSQIRDLERYAEFCKTYHLEEEADISIPTTSMHGRKTISRSEVESKTELARHGIPVPKQAVAKTEMELGGICRKMAFPLALKIDSPDILHKSDIGGVKLSIDSLEAAREAYRDILRSCRSAMPDARINGVIVQEMAPPGLEIIVGISSDETFGPMIVTGLGGVFVEVFKDVAMAPCPVSKMQAAALLRSLKSYRLLAGYRGKPPCDIDALATLIAQVSEYAAAHKDSLKELDLNPVIVYGERQGVMAVDAVIVEYVP